MGKNELSDQLQLYHGRSKASMALFNKNSPRVKELLLLKERVQENELTALAAQSTYYLVLSFFPFLIFLLTLISYTPLVQEDMLFEIRPFVPEETFALIMENIDNMLAARSGALLSSGMLVTIWLASNGMAAMLRGITKAFRDTERRPFWKVRGLAIVFTLAMGFLVILALLLVVFGQVIGEYVIDLLGMPTVFHQVWRYSRLVVALVSMVFVFTLFYRFGPNRKIQLQQSLPGAIFSTLGWLVLSYGFAFYVNNFGNYNVTYGSIAGVVILLVWLYLSSVIILLGGEINAWLIKTNHINNGRESDV
jgi:membrane protein